MSDITVPRITLVTVTFNGASVWAQFMASLEAQVGVDWHLVVIDNQSSDGTVDHLSAIDDPRVTVILNDANLGIASGNNQGIRCGLGKGSQRIVLINNDVEFAPDMLARLDARLDSEGVGAVSPLVPYFDAPDRIWYGGGAFRKWLRGITVEHEHMDAPLGAVGTMPFRTDYAPTCCVMFDRSVFEAVGLMDERYFVYYDDTDFMWRMRRAGIALVLDPSIVLLHKVSTSTGGRLSDFSIRFMTRNQIYYAKKTQGVGWAVYTAAVSLAIGLARVALEGDTPHQFRVRWRAVREGFNMAPNVELQRVAMS